jgi:hypothetical protein
MWDFRRYGTAEINGTDVHVAELVQFGGGATRVFGFHTVGFRVHPTEDRRLRGDIRGEDRLPLFVESADPDNAWIVVSHLPRDDSRWMTVQWLPLEPAGEALSATLEADWERTAREARTVRGRFGRLWRRVAARPLIRPVGPGGYPIARIKIGAGSPDDVKSVYSIVESTDPESGLLRV